MEPKKGKDKEANGGFSVSGESGANNGADSESKQSRRQSRIVFAGHCRVEQ